MTYVLDATAMIVYLRGEEGSELIAKILKDPDSRCVVHTINLCEVYSEFYRAKGEATAKQVIRDLEAVGISPDHSSEDSWMAAGRLKATLSRASLADCLAIALAQTLRGTLLTADHQAFDAIASLGVCQVQFLR